MSSPTGTELTADWVVVDIEGTMTATEQVHVVLYDYAHPRLGPWIDAHPDDPRVRGAVSEVKAEAGLPEDAGTGQVVDVLHRWMDEDRKATPLKTLQGLIWQDGYERGQLTTEYFPDVAPALREWHKRGLRLAMFSSGSVSAQVAQLSHTTDGDLRELFSAHFDTVNAGPKKEQGSYRVIASRLGDDARIAFLSDAPAELDAASSAGWRTVGLARAGEPFAKADFGDHPAVGDFEQIVIEAAP